MAEEKEKFAPVSLPLFGTSFFSTSVANGWGPISRANNDKKASPTRRKKIWPTPPKGPAADTRKKYREKVEEISRKRAEILQHFLLPSSPAQPIDLSPGDLLYYGGVEWLNISDFLGKIKKGLELHAMCFVFKSAVVFLCKERLRQKKKSLIVSRQQN